MVIKFKEVPIGETFVINDRVFVKIDEETADVISYGLDSPFKFDPEEDVDLESDLY
jgi:hypothetical protein